MSQIYENRYPTNLYAYLKFAKAGIRLAYNLYGNHVQYSPRRGTGDHDPEKINTHFSSLCLHKSAFILGKEFLESLGKYPGSLEPTLIAQNKSLVDYLNYYCQRYPSKSNLVRDI